jgi:hypothetical protein
VDARGAGGGTSDGGADDDAPRMAMQSITTAKLVGTPSLVAALVEELIRAADGCTAASQTYCLASSQPGQLTGR